jgi:plastocyanin
MRLNFAYGIIAIVGVLAAIILGLIAISPDDIIEPRITIEDNLTVCTMQWEPMCGVDGETYGNLCMLNSADIKLDYEGECVIEQSTVEPEMKMPTPGVTDVEEMIIEPTPEPTIEVTSETLSIPAIVSIPPGVAVPGCDDTDECYSPYQILVTTGTTVAWSNDDSAAHTVTSGTPADGPDGMFDSSLFMSGSTFEFTFDDAGSFDYFCMVHPWMTGIINVS